MSSTNKTTNYQLSQFIGSDKPAWLTDYNGDMTKIDTALKTISDNADSKISEVNTADVVDGAITANKIAVDAVTSDKIRNGNVSTDKLASSAVSSAKLADDAVTTSKIANSAVSAEKINWSTMDNYSTSEIDTNKTWIDGKKIYRIVVTGTINIATANVPQFTNETFVSGADTLINSYGSWNDYGSQWSCIGQSGVGSTVQPQYMNVMMLDGGAIKGVARANTTGAKAFKIVVEYTKA